MNWDAVGATGEILGSLAVIGSIFYLALQVRHAAAVAKAATQQSAAQMSIDSMTATLDSQILSTASRKASNEEELNPEELSYNGPDLSTTSLRLIGIQSLPENFWFKLDAKIPVEWDNGNAVPATGELQLGKMFSPAFGVYMDGLFGIGDDKPYE